jgi:hypothetical protein
MEDLELEASVTEEELYEVGKLPCIPHPHELTVCMHADTHMVCTSLHAGGRVPSPSAGHPQVQSQHVPAPAACLHQGVRRGQDPTASLTHLRPPPQTTPLLIHMAISRTQTLQGIGAVAASASTEELRQLAACIGQAMAADPAEGAPPCREILSACLGQLPALGEK